MLIESKAPGLIQPADVSLLQRGVKDVRRLLPTRLPGAPHTCLLWKKYSTCGRSKQVEAAHVALANVEELAQAGGVASSLLVHLRARDEQQIRRWLGPSNHAELWSLACVIWGVLMMKWT